MSLRFHFWFLVIVLMMLSVVDMIVTLVGVEKGVIWELNPFIGYYFLDSPVFAIMVKAIVPFFISLYLYHRPGLEGKTIFAFGRRFCHISSFLLLYLFISIYMMASLNALFWVHVIYWFL